VTGDSTSHLSLLRGGQPSKSQRPVDPTPGRVDRGCTAVVADYDSTSGHSRCGRGANEVRELFGREVLLCWQHAKKFDRVYWRGERDDMSFILPDGTRLERPNPGPGQALLSRSVNRIE
jgi:hypothetical protein